MNRGNKGQGEAWLNTCFVNTCLVNTCGKCFWLIAETDGEDIP